MWIKYRMNDVERKKIISDDYADLIVEYGKYQAKLSIFQNDTINIVDDKYAIVYIPKSRITQQFIHKQDYSIVPKLLGLVDTTSLEEMGVNKIRNIPSLGLLGQDVLLGFIDTGIEYTNPLFQNANHTTRIVSIWDQTIENMQASKDIFYYGTEYIEAQINQALQDKTPLSIVPSTDEIGHGTMLAGLAGGSVIPESDFSGVVPASQFVIVKLKPAKSNLKQFYMVPESTLCYQENDLIFGIAYLLNVATRLKKPIAICIGLGTNQGSHDGRLPMSDFMYARANQIGVAIVIAGGNEGNTGHHYYGTISPKVGYDTVELKVGEGESGFTMELWGSLPGTYSIDITSPNGEYIPRILPKLQESRNITFVFEKTNIQLDYFVIEAETGDQLILLRFKEPTPGIWKFKVYAGKISSGFHIWLPMRGFITENTAFVKPDNYTTITGPGYSLIPITVTAYNHKEQKIYPNSGNGYSRINLIKPDLAAPGENVYSPLLNNQFGEKSGTSVAAALTTGAAAMLLEWGIVKNNYPTMNCTQVKKLLIRGVHRNENLTYPNREWGYGTLNIYSTFDNLRGES